MVKYIGPSPSEVVPTSLSVVTLPTAKPPTTTQPGRTGTCIHRREVGQSILAPTQPHSLAFQNLKTDLPTRAKVRYQDAIPWGEEEGSSRGRRGSGCPHRRKNPSPCGLPHNTHQAPENSGWQPNPHLYQSGEAMNVDAPVAVNIHEPYFGDGHQHADGDSFMEMPEGDAISSKALQIPAAAC